jgi:hypothetical protein
LGDRDAESPVEVALLPKVPVATIPRSRREVCGEPLRASVSHRWGQRRQAGHAGLNERIEVGLGASPEGDTEAVRAVMRDEQPADLDDVEALTQQRFTGRLPQRCRPGGTREVLERPERRFIQGRAVPHDLATRHAAQLEQSAARIAPVVHRENRHRGVEGAITKGQRLGHGADDVVGCSTLTDHLDRWLDRYHRPVNWFVAPRAGSDVEKRPACSEGAPQRIGKSRISPAGPTVRLADVVVDGHREQSSAVRPPQRDEPVTRMEDYRV